ncbi:hypothetical protein TREAZ_1954 [Leadbettera azotonutricia ZAS-9]|uniref:Uncharacterized protein n=2 Tax=Leadbettera azotonutricia TaxID=150829 RepID=F5YAQ0_LEAAZ|nr:hypothetical protein TREAZ_1954 [Leadbettera azotonutricia ZAS-9]
MGLLIWVMLPPPLSPLVNRVSALGRGGSGVYGADGTAYGALSYGLFRRQCRRVTERWWRYGDNGPGWRGWGPGFFTPIWGEGFTLGQCGVKKGGVNELGKAGRLLSFLLSGGLIRGGLGWF